MINKISSQPNINKQSQTGFGAKVIPPKLGQELNAALFKTKSVDIYLHNSHDHDTAEAAAYIYERYEAKGIKAYLCANKKELAELGLNPKKYRIKKSSKPSELTVLLDHNGFDKLSDTYKSLIKKVKNIVTIDHHPETENTIKSAVSYIDTTAKSCCAILYRIAESLGEKLKVSEAQKLFKGIVDDYGKSKRIGFKSTPQGSDLVRLPALSVDTNSAEVLDSFEKILSKEERTKIYNQLDIVSNLTKAEQEFRRELFSKVQVTSNGKMAYAIIDPKDKKWKALGMDNMRNSVILRDLRLRLINGVENEPLFTPQQIESFKNSEGKIDIQGAVVFYSTPKKGKNKKGFQISLHSKKDTKYTKKWRAYAKEAYDKKELERAGKIKYEMISGGHDDRSGGRIPTFDKKAVQNFIESFLEAGENVE